MRRFAIAVLALLAALPLSAAVKVIGPSPWVFADPGVPYALTVFYYNDSRAVTEGTIRIELPEGTSIASLPEGCTGGGRVATCAIAPLAAQEQRSLSIAILTPLDFSGRELFVRLIADAGEVVQPVRLIRTFVVNDTDDDGPGTLRRADAPGVDLAGNVIAYNEHLGVAMAAVTENALARNRIRGNAELPIDLGLNGRSPVFGPRYDEVAAPELLRARYDPVSNTTVVEGQLRRWSSSGGGAAPAEPRRPSRVLSIGVLARTAPGWKARRSRGNGAPPELLHHDSRYSLQWWSSSGRAASSLERRAFQPGGLSRGTRFWWSSSGCPVLSGAPGSQPGAVLASTPIVME